MSSGALVSIANKYGETPTDKAKTPLREVLKGTRVPQDPITDSLQLATAGSGCHLPPPPSAERAEKLGQNLTKIPYKDTFWKGTTRTRPSKD